MGSGLIFAVIVVMWLAYLVPTFAARRSQHVEQEVEEPFSDSMTVLRRSANPLSEDPDPDLEISTPLTRAAARFEVRRSHRIAATRRRRVMLVLTGASLLGVVLAVAGTLPVWVILVPLALLVAFVLVARFSVVTLNRTLDARMARIDRGWEEDTISFEVPADLREDSSEHSIELSAPILPSGSLWDPIPVTAPTYVSKPMVPRTIRTIDLSMPAVSAPDPTPVVAEARVDANTTTQELRRAAGE